MDKVTFKNHTSLIEGVSNGFTFSLIDAEGVTMHTPAQCKDYLQDLWWSEYNEKPTSVWGFTWKPGKIKTDEKLYRFALRDDRSKTLLDRKKGMVSYLNAFEKALGFDLSTIEETENGNNVLILNAAGGWFKHCPMISAFTTITRLGMLYEGGDPIEYITGLAKKFPKDGGYYGKAPAGFFDAMMADLGRIKTILPRLKLLMSGEYPKAKWTEFSTGGNAHEGGIIGYGKWGC